MNSIFSKVQLDFNKLQKTLEHEGEIMLSKILEAASKAAQNEKILARKQEIEDLFDKQIKRFEPAVGKFYQNLKLKAGKYGVDLDKIEHNLKSTTEQAAIRLHLKTKVDKATKPTANSSKKSDSAGNRKKAKKKV